MFGYFANLNELINVCLYFFETKMVKSCCALNCRNSFKNGSKITFHRFPKNIDQRNAWIRAINRYNWEPSIHAWICSSHFKSDDFEKVGLNHRLRQNAVPSIFKISSWEQESSNIILCGKELQNDAKVIEPSKTLSTDNNKEGIFSACKQTVGETNNPVLISSSEIIPVQSFAALPLLETVWNKDESYQILSRSVKNNDNPLLLSEANALILSRIKAFHSYSSVSRTDEENISSDTIQCNSTLTSCSSATQKSNDQYLIDTGSMHSFLLSDSVQEEIVTTSTKKSCNSNISSNYKKCKLKRLKHAVQCFLEDDDTLETLKQKVGKLSSTVQSQKIKIKSLQQSERRLKTKVTNLEHILSVFQKEI